MSEQRATLGATGVFAVPKTNPADKPAASSPDREGRAPLPFWATTAANKQLRFLAAEHDTHQQALMTEVLNLLFRKYGKPPIA
jgi:hypothetical protein